MKNTHKTYTVKEATHKMMQFCVYRDRCHKEVEEKLWEMRMIPEAKEKIIGTLIQEDFLNEERFAQSYARGKFNIKKWGKVRIIRELKLRNISPRNIDTALKEIKERKYRETLYELATKKLALIEDKNKFKRKKKLYDHLYRKGYETNLIYEALNELV